MGLITDIEQTMIQFLHQRSDDLCDTEMYLRFEKSEHPMESIVELHVLYNSIFIRYIEITR